MKTYAVIRNMAKYPENFCRCPEKNFTRNRKLPFEKLLTLLAKMGGRALRDKLLDCVDFKETPACGSGASCCRTLWYIYSRSLRISVTDRSCTKDTALREKSK